MKKRLVSGIKPTGQLTLGNYLGAIKQFVKLQDEYEMFIFIADLHSLTLPISAEDLKINTRNLINIYLAAGLDLKYGTKIFKQSDIPEHTQLEWILTCNTDLPDLLKMPQYKNYVEHNLNKAIPTGVLMYPSLMNADILLYDADVVPVGADQVPHIDLTKDVAKRFNKRYPDSFKIPKPLIQQVGAKIMSLSDPTKKMSKSESDIGTIYLFDDEITIRNKINKALTDSEDKVYYDPTHKPGISNLMTIYSCLTGKTFVEIEFEFKNIQNYKAFKIAVADAVWKELSILQEKVKQFDSMSLAEDTLEQCRPDIKAMAAGKLAKIYKIVGLN